MKLDRWAGFVFGLIVLALVLGFLLYGAHQFSQVMDNLENLMGGGTQWMTS